MKTSLPVLVAIILWMCCQSCSSKPEEPEPDTSNAIARVGSQVLDKNDYVKRFQSAGAVSDSVKYSKRIIDMWASEALLYEDAIQKLGEDELELNKQVEEYRKALVNHLYQSRIIEANLDTLITEQEIRDYYNKHSNNFVLKDNIVKVEYIKVPVQAPDIEKIKRLLKSPLPKDRITLIALCEKNAENFFLNDSTWLYTADIRKEIPKLSEEPDFSLYTGKVVLFEDETYLYYLKIKDVKIKNGLSPLNFERENIKKYILLKRKTQLISEFRQNLLDEAKSAKKIQIFPVR
ncbi:MAG TPA: hypothetical protein PLQ93_12465 [Bacteroidia bacterium]|nr:hypothetical protein [Bacteroidia bacterium]